jgi:hypothetical protein
MATSVEIAAAIADATSLGILPSQMVVIIDRAIAAALTTGSGSAATGELPAVSYAINGRSRTISMTEAQNLRKYYASVGDYGGIIGQDVEFSS